MQSIILAHSTKGISLCICTICEHATRQLKKQKHLPLPDGLFQEEFSLLSYNQ